MLFKRKNKTKKIKKLRKNNFFKKTFGKEGFFNQKIIKPFGTKFILPTIDKSSNILNNILDIGVHASDQGVKIVDETGNTVTSLVNDTSKIGNNVTKMFNIPVMLALVGVGAFVYIKINK